MNILEKREQKGIERGLEQGIEQGIEQGLEQGLEQGRREMVKDFIRAGAETELIIKASKFSREEVEAIRKEMLS